MTVEAIRLQNFMAFEDTGWIELRPICLVFGANSSGKSAIVRALRLLRQSLTCTAEDAPLRFVAEHGIDQGGFKSTVHQETLETAHTDLVSEEQEEEIEWPRMTFHFRCQVVRNLDALRAMANRQRENLNLPAIPAGAPEKLVELKLVYAWDDRLQLDEIRIRSPWSVDAGQDRRDLFLATRIDDETAAILGERWWVGSHILAEEEFGSSTPWSGISVGTRLGFLPTLQQPISSTSQEWTRTEGYELVENMLYELCDIVEKYLTNMEYLGPIRPEPQRVYALDTMVQQQWNNRGLAGYLSFLRDRIDPEVMDEIAHWLQHLGLANAVQPDTGGYRGPLAVISEVNLREFADGPWINLTDMGFGVSQVLPVLVQSLLQSESAPQSLEPGQVIVEQPELHLHPRCQAQLADFFVSACRRNWRREFDRSRREGLPEPPHESVQDARFLLETHSEHLLLRLRWHIADRTLRTLKGEQSHSSEGHYRFELEDLAVYFVSRNDRGVSHVHTIEINDQGDIVEEPVEFRQFFADDAIEIMNLTHLSLQAEMLKEAGEL